ncbi:MAG: Ppx/GppA family phosphatase, partial [Bryobacteraceae bacterium]|nr:Ppx/GppA family phosphatase [Bryobacteraceae bacterium]
GHIISDTAHHKHSQYIVAHSDLPGFTDHERNLVAMLCRYHRKAMPMPKHLGYQSLTADERRAVLLLTPILRIADGLDRGRELRVEGIDCQIRNGGVVLSIYSDQDTALEQWAAEQAGEVFRQVYDKPLLVVQASKTPNATLA